jgi:hypothetical protein
MLLVPVSVGELMDKITILEIKSEQIDNSEKLQNVNRELDLLYEISADIKIGKYIKDLREVNKKLWEIEDRIREKEQLSEFDDEFVQLARSVYITNDRRSDIKRFINESLGSEIIEEKFYQHI